MRRFPRPTTRSVPFWCGLVVLVIGVGSMDRSPRVAAQSSPTPLSYTPAQAERGQAAYMESCASCHGQHLDDGAFAPPLKGVEFREKWGPRRADALFILTSTTMPTDRPGALGDETYAQLLAYILQENGATPGARELPADPEALKAMASPDWPRAGGGGLAPGASIPPPPPRANPLDSIRAVTDAMLASPPDGAWLMWRRTYDAFGFSPLKKISRANIDRLRIAWTWTLPRGTNQSAPLVHDGVMFVLGYGDNVQALDARTGDLLWQYSRRLPRGVGPSVKRSMSIYGTRLYVPTSDVHIVALDVKTGAVVWDMAVGDPKAGFRMTGGPIVARGKVMIGTTGRAEGGNYIVALDADTGKEAWRFYSIARPDAPGGASWNGVPLEKRNGGSFWIPGSFDPVQGLAFFAPGNTYDTAPLRNSVNQPGVTNDGLYLDSTLALDVDTGRLAWHFQHQANGQWDLDWAFERQIIELPVNGRMRRVVLTGGKQMIFDMVDAESGRYISSLDVGTKLGLQNVVTAIDAKTGAKIVDASLVPGDGQTKMICPHVGGGRDWMPTSYNPSSRVLYIPLVEACMDLVPVAEGERGNLTTGVRWTVRPPPASDGKYGRMQALHVETGKTVWTERQRAPVTSGVLATAGGLVFVGGLDRMFSAHDAVTGDRLWNVRLNDVPAGVPISYSVNGQEYVAVIAAPGGYQSRAYTVLVPEIQNPPDQGATLWVFEVPQNSAAKATR